MSIPENIQQLADKVRKEIYGRDVRESIASSMEATAEVAEWSRKVAQDIVDGKFDEGELATEIERKLNELETQYAPRLDEVTSQLAQFSGFNSNTISPIYNTEGQITHVVEKEGTTTIMSTELTYNIDGSVATVSETYDDKTVTYALNYINGELSTVNKTLTGGAI